MRGMASDMASRSMARSASAPGGPSDADDAAGVDGTGAPEIGPWLGRLQHAPSSSITSASGTPCQVSENYSARLRGNSKSSPMLMGFCCYLVRGAFRGEYSRPERSASTAGSRRALNVEGVYLMTQLKHRHRIQSAAIIPGDDVEVLHAEPIFRTSFVLIVNQYRRCLVGQGGRRHYASAAQFLPWPRRLHTIFQQGVDIHSVRRCRHSHGAAAIPAVFLEVIGDAANSVHRIVPEVAVAVAVEIDRIAAEAARDELRLAEGAGVGAFHVERIDALLAGQNQVLLELAAKEFGAGRVVEGQRRERIDDAIFALVSPVAGLDADDGGDDLGRHAVSSLGALQSVDMALPELCAAFDARALNEDRAVLVPRFAFGRTRDRVDNVLAEFHLLEPSLELRAIETVTLHHLDDEGGDLVARIAGRGRWRS